MPIKSTELDAPTETLESNLDDIFVDFIMSKRRESSEIDFKMSLDISKERFAELAKDIFAMANSGGGYIVLGIKEEQSGKFTHVGLPDGFHIDQADLQQRFNSYSQDPISIGYREFSYQIEDNTARYAMIYIPPSTMILRPNRDGISRSARGKEKTLFKSGDILTRRGTQSIRATEEESQSIEKRSEESLYAISLTTGNPDRITETLYSNLFEVKKYPTVIYSGTTAFDQIPFATRLLAPFVTQGDTIHSFRDLTEEPLNRITRKKTITKHRTADWLQDKDKCNIVLWLLDSTLIWEASQLGMFHQRKGKKLYYPLRYNEKIRHEKWPGLVRQSKRQVATMMHASQLGESIGVHPAASVHCTMIGDRIFLRLTPTYVLTSDGRRIRSGPDEGRIITRLSHDDYNMIYLRNMLFWISKLGGTDNTLSFEEGRFLIDATPITVTIESGISSDRCSLEGLKSGQELRQYSNMGDT